MRDRRGEKERRRRRARGARFAATGRSPPLSSLSYPYNLDFDSYKELEGLSRFCINNLGDPFIESNYGVHSREFEIGVLEWFARLWEADADYWGYITNCGTEGNLHGILVGRENLPDAVLYASAETHYSVFKAARMYRMPVECVPTQDSGEIDYGEFKAALEKNAGLPAVVVVNCGTTVRGAVDDLDEVLKALAAAGYAEDRVRRRGRGERTMGVRANQCRSQSDPPPHHFPDRPVLHPRRRRALRPHDAVCPGRPPGDV